MAIPEHEIACKVLGRREGFNPNDDNIVRVQAGHLRKKLEQYFATEGREEPYVLEIPKGAYVPRFVPRLNTSESRSTFTAETSFSARAEQEPASVFPRTQTALENEPSVAGLSDQSLLKARWKLQSLPKVPSYWLLAAFSLGIVAMICFYRLASTPPLIAAARGLPRNMIEQRIFASGAPLSIVTTDSSLVLLQNTLHTDISISDYVGGQYPSNLLAHSSDDARRVALENATAGRYTSLGDLTIAWQCQELAQQLGTSATLRYARYMSVRDFEKGNFILIGSRRGNPWISLFEPQLNFALEEDKETHQFHFLNKTPEPGEQKTYANEQEPHGDYLSYVAIALVPNLTKTGYVLLLNGSIMDSNEAAAHLVFDGDLSPPLLQAINHQAADKSEYLEIFLRVHSLQGAPSKFDVIGTRTGVINF
ncbi:hypothetical protein [Granulicella sp. S156]|uniref:hypothetical protein n=1 Tax=Granulicella sp. S156 TaxID=1747224 RepID=UPI00131E67CC|nr:hypothetical protein [Granulicella sp. S156]